ncbi:hypothetical protein IWT25_00516 [Secundilactobacillus pentosiphilus]|uniref:MucBP domain-containing protein n=1 Tax=Secundilactobacillus pentosiphilus TaxID=1714682 RepID=A0A1Z5IUD5_9LACO|nr:MucBP domain-containing protein [Secundilactobacillus pentosiphilus]GAX05212.1 hypothetical protein IWT25_00516 [Secundilactobacillus pentosiphilus]
MTFLDQLLKLMTKNQSQSPSRSKKTAPTDGSALKAKQPPLKSAEPLPDSPVAEDGSSQTEAVSQHAPSKLAESQAASAVMLVLYMDDQNHSLAKPQWLTGRLGEKIHFAPRKIDHYLLFHVIGFTTVFASPYRIMTLQYTRKLGHPVIMYAVDYDTREMVASPVIQTGAVNQPFAFSKAAIDGYHLIKASRPLTGHFTDQAQTIVVLLRRDTWTSVQQINIFVRLLDSTPVLNQPDGQPHRYEFPKDSVWRAFVRVNTKNGETWFNLGGPQWINGKDVTETNRPVNLQITQRQPVKFKPMDQAAVIDFVAGRSLHTYDRPNGQAIKLIADGTPIQLTGEYTDENQLRWYRLADDAVIRAQYVKIQ